MNSYGSESMGEVSKGTASTTFTGHRSQPGDVRSAVSYSE